MTLRFIHYFVISLMMILTAPVYPMVSLAPAESIEELLPAENEIKPWTKSGKPDLYKGRQLFEYIDGGADIYLEYGFEQVISQEFSHQDESIVVDIYEMSDPEAAYGIYSIHRDPQKPAARAGDDGTEFDYQITFWQDHYYVVILGYSTDQATKAVLRSFAQNISRLISVHAKPPEIIHSLPSKFKVPRSEGSLEGILAVNSRLYLGQKNILNVDGAKVKAACANYKNAQNIAQLLFIKYPSIGEAVKHKNAVYQLFKKKYKTTHSDKTIFFKDGKNRFYSVKSMNHSVIIIYKSNSKIMIQNILVQFTSNKISHEIGGR